MRVPIAENIDSIRDRITDACQRSHRPKSSVTLIAVSKKQPFAAIETAYAAGQRHFGESYIQEASEKIAANRHNDLVWHAIGAVQSNKIKVMSEKFSWFHGLHSQSQLKELVKQPESILKNIKVLIQINLENEPSKAGLLPEEAELFLNQIDQLNLFSVCGLMTLPPPQETAEESRRFFVKLRELQERLNRLSFKRSRLTELSMGMSLDFEVAIEEGATLVRIGEGIFGPRPS